MVNSQNWEVGTLLSHSPHRIQSLFFLNYIIWKLTHKRKCGHQLRDPETCLSSWWYLCTTPMCITQPYTESDPLILVLGPYEYNTNAIPLSHCLYPQSGSFSSDVCNFPLLVYMLFPVRPEGCTAAAGNCLFILKRK